MNTSTTSTETNTLPPIMRYWGMVKDMDNNLKLELIAMLISSMRLNPDATDKDKRERGFRSLAGCWADDHGEDDMEAIIRRGREGRKGSRIVPSFDE